MVLDVESTLLAQVYPPSIPRVRDKLGGQQHTAIGSARATVRFGRLTFEPVISDGRLIAIRGMLVGVAELGSVQTAPADNIVV
jgi:hypothetical protein